MHSVSYKFYQGEKKDLQIKEPVIQRTFMELRVQEIEGNFRGKELLNA